MPRTLLSDAPSFSPKELDGFSITLQTITPMFGGSAIARKVDPEFPVRAASVRGHLRFWWRATAGAQYSDPKKLHEAESAIWGNTDTPGRVRIEVQILEAGQECEPIEHKYHQGKVKVRFGEYPAYALFPFQGTIKHGKTESPPDKARKDIKFKIKISCPSEFHEEIGVAINAWVMFGGIGSRTRRGCGSLQFCGAQDIRILAPKYSKKVSVLLTTLPSQYLIGEVHKSAEDAWYKAVDVYRRFRQGEKEARHARGIEKTPGRSYWPEPDRIRLIRNKYFDGYHKDGSYKKHEPDKDAFGFPRADLGLPITFHFKDEGLYKKYDPTDQELKGAKKNSTRFASPVITKAIAVEGGFAPMIMILDSPHVWDDGTPGVLLCDSKSPKKIETPISKKELRAGRQKYAYSAPDVRTAFYNFSREAHCLNRELESTGVHIFIDEVRL